MVSKRHKGLAIVLIIATLSIVSSLCVVFVRTAIMERAGAQNYYIQCSSKLNAYAGMDAATALLQNIQHFSEFSPLTLHDDWQFKNGDATQLGSGYSLKNANIHAPVIQQCIPSFVLRNQDNSPKTLGGHYVSGFVEPNDDFSYALKIMDCSAQINLNNPTFRVIHMLTSLFGEVFSSSPHNATSWEEMAVKILQHRNSQSSQTFVNKKQLMYENLLTSDEYAKISDFVTVDSWKNPHMWEISNRDLYDLAKVNYMKPGQLDTSGANQQPRAPININTADVVVLVATLANLKGYSRFTENEGIDPYKKLRIKKQLIELSTDLARQVANAIVAHRRDFTFKLWPKNCPAYLQNHSFFHFIDNLSIGGLTQQHKDLIKANANPNAMCNHFIPNSERYLSIDKWSLVVPTSEQPLQGATTEFCFSSMGVFEVESCGRFHHPLDKSILGEHTVKAILRVKHPTMHTTQRHFFADSVHNNVVLFPETAYHCLSSSLLNEQGSEVVQGGSTIDGYIQLQNTVEHNSGRSFTLFFDQQNFDDLWSAKVGSNYQAAEIQQKSPTVAHSVNATTKARSIFHGEFRSPEGSLSFNHGSTTSNNAPNGGQAIAFDKNNLNVTREQGTIALWIKFENIDAGADESILHISHVTDVGGISLSGFETGVYRYYNEFTNSNELHISRWVWEQPKDILNLVQLDNLDIPLRLWTRIVIPDIHQNRQSRKWYRLVIAWENYTDIHAVFTHDGVNNNATSLFHYSESLPNTIPNSALVTLHLDRIAMSNLDSDGNLLSNSSLLSIGGYSFTPTLSLPFFNQLDLTLLAGIGTFRFSNTLITKVEGYNSCLISTTGAPFYQKPYPHLPIANPGGTFEQQMQLDCGCAQGCERSLQVRKAEFTIWKPGSLSQVEFAGESISDETAELLNVVVGKCGEKLPYRVLLTSDDGETTPIFDDITTFAVLDYPEWIWHCEN